MHRGNQERGFLQKISERQLALFFPLLMWMVRKNLRWSSMRERIRSRVGGFSSHYDLDHMSPAFLFFTRFGFGVGMHALMTFFIK